MHQLDIQEYFIKELLKVEKELKVKKKLCLYPYCPNLAIEGSAYCNKHQKQTNKKQYKYYSLYASPAWRRLRNQFIKEHPICVHCGGKATVVDHIKPHEGNMELFFDTHNLQPLCSSCHNRKTGYERGENK